jgi:hypothetical protein
LSFDCAAIVVAEEAVADVVSNSGCVLSFVEETASEAISCRHSVILNKLKRLNVFHPDDCFTLLTVFDYLRPGWFHKCY